MKMMAATMGVVEKVVPVPPDYSSEYLRTVQKNVTVPQQKKGPALSSLRFPFASLKGFGKGRL